MKIGIYGGTFNPPHLGHLAAAQAAVDTLGLDKLIWMPAANPPHKTLPENTPSQESRLEMTKLMADAMGRPDVVEVSSLEMERAGNSYTADTLAELQRQYPQGELWLLVGTDMFQTIHLWKRPEEILSLAKLCAFGREQGDVDAFAQQKAYLERTFGATVEILSIPDLVEVSSTQLREQLLADDKEVSLLPTVYGYILRHSLYGTQEDLTKLPLHKLRACSLSMVKAKRIPHILGTEETAVKLARHWGGDETAARRAAILHDCTKYWTAEEHIALCDKFGRQLDDIERGAVKLLHSKSGACMAQYIFGETEEVVEAISWHTTGRSNMTLLEKIIYIADYMEPNRVFDGVETLRELAYTDLDRAVCLGVDMTIEEMTERGYHIHIRTLEASKWLHAQEQSL